MGGGASCLIACVTWPSERVAVSRSKGDGCIGWKLGGFCVLGKLGGCG